MNEMMETQSDSIDVTSIKSAALRAFDPPKAANFELDVSGNDRLKAIQHAFQRSVAAATTTISSQHTGYQTAATSRHPAQHLTQQTTFSELASTVPETQTLIDVGNPLPTIPYGVSGTTDRLPKTMSTQGSVPQDTQPVSQSIYEGILNKVKSVRQLEQGANGADNGAGVQEEQDSLQEGDEGHIDLLSSYKAPANRLSDDSDSEPVDFSPTQNQHYLSQFPESQRFKTPGTTSRKRDYNGEIIDTPSLPRNPLARGGAPTPGKMMGLSQAFAATQAVSSPLVNGPLSGPISDRPSPNIELQTRLATGTFSSPLHPKSDLRTATTEPYSHYKSIKQSQAERERLSLFGLRDDIALGDNVSDDDFDDEPSLVERTRRLKEREQKVQRQLQAVSSPNRPRSRGNADPLSPLTSRALLSSPRTSPRSRGGRTGSTQDNCLISAVPVVPENEFTDPNHDSEEETEKEDEVEIARSSQLPIRDEEDKENLEFARLEVPETVARLQDAIHGYHGLESSPSVRQSAGFDSRKDGHAGWNGLEPFAVANSQPSQLVEKPAHPPRTQLASSEEGPSFVPQSQVLANGIRISSSPERSNLFQSSINIVPGGIAAEKPESEIIVERRPGRNERLPSTELGQPGLNVELDEQVDHGPKATVQSPRQKFNGAPDSEMANKTNHSASKNALRTGLTIPEANSSGRREFQLASSAPWPDGSNSASSLSGQMPRSSAEFETAQTHQSTTAKNVLPPLPQQSSFVKNSPSGRKRQRMIDITQDLSPRNSNSEIDMDVAMETVVDKDFQFDTSSPISPRRRIRRRRLQERHAGTVIEKVIPPLLQPPEDVSPRSDKSHGLAPEDISPANYVDVDSIDSASNSAQVMRPMPRSTTVRHHLNIPTQKPFLGRATTRSSRARDDLFDIQVSPEQSGRAKPNRSAPNPQDHPSTMPTRKVRALVSVPGASSATQVDRPIRQESRGSVSTPSEGPDSLAIDVSDNSSPSANVPPGDVIAPNQVLACFYGKTRAYYPATCLGITESDSLRYQIQWEGFEADETDARGVRKLDLRIGDSVKVNLDGFPRVSHIVRGFKDKVIPSGKGGPMTDIRGYSILLVAPKQRKSLPANLGAESVKEVPVSAIYLDSNMWSQMKGREYEYIPRQAVSGLGFATPPERPSTPATPSSRGGRNLTISTNAAFTDPAGIFTDMAFAISYDEARKSSLTHLIRQNGGIVLPDGFHELFASDRTTPKPSYVNLGFTALLADRHSRKEKYMQALALNLPCLSGRWIESCIAKESIIDWQPYLLPAGESALLDGAIRSRVLPAIPEPSVAKMVEIIEMRPRLLCDGAVVFVTGRGKVEEKRKPFLFLTQAIGAGRVEKAIDLKAAKTLLDSEDSQSNRYKWVFVDDSQVSLAKDMLESEQGGNGDQIRVVGNEFICQSLILGGLVEK